MNQVSVAEAPGVDRVDVEPVNKAERRQLYRKREKIHPRLARGNFRRLKWAIMAVTLSIYYLAPWIRWDRGPNTPDQAILIDLPARRFYFFFIEIWPQEIYYVTGLLILAALTLFLITSLAGRVWCGYTCPQTVWTDLFIAVERLVEGDRGARIRLDKQSFSMSKLTKRVVKHAVWLLIAVGTGGAWVFYFADAPALAVDLVTFQAPQVAYISIGVLTATTYVFGGFAREQVCTYMCPWPRIQAAMVDEDSLIVTYQKDRGEPRGPHRKGESWEGRGDCIDCNQCVAVCPMGIDIRDGMQLECISCALCIDACNDVMDRIDLPRGLIGYDTAANMALRAQGETPRVRMIRIRTLVYIGVIVVVGLIMLGALLTRPTLDVNVLRDRNPLFVMLSDGSLRNGYTLKILNKQHDVRTFDLAVDGMPGAQLKLAGATANADTSLTVGSDRLAAFRVFVTLPPGAVEDASTPIGFVVTDTSDGTVARYESVFLGPGA